MWNNGINYMCDKSKFERRKKIRAALIAGDIVVEPVETKHRKSKQLQTKKYHDHQYESNFSNRMINHVDIDDIIQNMNIDIDSQTKRDELKTVLKQNFESVSPKKMKHEAKSYFKSEKYMTIDHTTLAAIEMLVDDGATHMTQMTEFSN